MIPVTIRLATAADFRSVYDSINLLEDEIMDEAVQHELFLRNLANPDIIYLLAFTDNVAVGLLGCHIQNLMHHGGRIGEIQEMIVADSVRGMGVGKQLVNAVGELAKNRNVVQLEVTSRLSRTHAHRFYEREGFAFTHKKFTLPLDR